MVVQKRSLDILLVVGLTSSDPRYDTLYLSNYATINLLDVIKRVPGVLAVTPEALNPYLVLYHRKIVLFKEALPRIEEVFGR